MSRISVYITPFIAVAVAVASTGVSNCSNILNLLFAISGT
jgi:hypothetical protein